MRPLISLEIRKATRLLVQISAETPAVLTVCVFSLSFSRQRLAQYLNLRRYLFLPNRFQFVIH